MANTDQRRITLLPSTYDRLKSLNPDATKPELSEMIDRIVETQLTRVEVFVLPYWVELFEDTGKHVIKCGDQTVSDPLYWDDAYTIAKALNADSLSFIGYPAEAVA